MSFHTSSARLALASPSVSLEKGAYRLRAPRTRTASSPKSKRLHRDPAPATYEKHATILIAFLISATLASFGSAYYLFTTK
ncbi:hypothetical protein A0H81_08986 [Grifola frondosa]|uniref:Uncharacterized protein n=1 Tax=Grifola frondosa TaxID=5627 RepID=A0A1C7M5S0_GRIFR|nr:hypothetical protein A0H81_08986 [Grifola frondosa]